MSWLDAEMCVGNMNVEIVKRCENHNGSRTQTNLGKLGSGVVGGVFKIDVV